MTEFKLNIADPKTSKCIQRTIADPAAAKLIGAKIGDTIKGEDIDLPGYEFQVTGGSDHCGFPMRKGIAGTRKRILALKSVGFRGGRRGMRKRKTVCGEAVHAKISQINLKILKQGKEKLFEAKEAKKEEAPKEAPKKEEKPKLEKKEEPKEKEKPKEKKEEAK